MSRNEDILQAIINGESLENFRPQSRMEALLLQLGGASGGGSGEVVECNLLLTKTTIEGIEDNATYTVNEEGNQKLSILFNKLDIQKPKRVDVVLEIENPKMYSTGILTYSITEMEGVKYFSLDIRVSTIETEYDLSFLDGALVGIQGFLAVAKYIELTGMEGQNLNFKFYLN